MPDEKVKSLSEFVEIPEPRTRGSSSSFNICKSCFPTPWRTIGAPRLSRWVKSTDSSPQLCAGQPNKLLKNVQEMSKQTKETIICEV